LVDFVAPDSKVSSGRFGVAASNAKIMRPIPSRNLARFLSSVISICQPHTQQGAHILDGNMRVSDAVFPPYIVRRIFWPHDKLQAF